METARSPRPCAALLNRRPARRWRCRCHRSIRVVRCSAGGCATAWARRWRARADPLGGLRGDGRFQASVTSVGVVLRFQGRGVDLVGEVAGQALVRGVDVGGDLGVPAEQVDDALGAQSGGVVHAAWAERPAHRVRPYTSPMTVAFIVFSFFLPDTKARRPWLACSRATDLDFGAVQAQRPRRGPRVSEHIAQRAQPQPGLPGTANPRAASSGRISRTARVMVERSPRKAPRGPRAGAGTAARQG